MKTQPVNAITVKLPSEAMLNDLTAVFDCFTRCDTLDEIILDTAFFGCDEDNDVSQLLWDALGITSDSKLAQEIAKNNYVIFYLGE